MSKTLWCFKFKLPGLFLIILLFTGCTTIPVGRYDVLANSSQEILSNTSETYVRIEKLQRRFLVETATGDVKLNSNDPKPFAPLIEINGKTESFDLTPELHFREAALQVLVKYCLVLQAFAKRDFEGEVDKAAAGLAGSLKSLASATVPKNVNAQEASGMLATVINVIGREIVRKNRLKALKNVMDTAQPHMDTLSALIASDNKKINNFVNIMLKRILTRRESQRPSLDTLGRTGFDTDASLLISEVTEIKKSLDKINSAIKKIPRAHAETRKKLDDESQGFDALAQLVGEVQGIDKLYRTLK